MDLPLPAQIALLGSTSRTPIRRHVSPVVVLDLQQQAPGKLRKPIVVSTSPAISQDLNNEIPKLISLEVFRNELSHVGTLAMPM